MTDPRHPERNREWLQDILMAIEKVERRGVAGRSAFYADDVLQDSIIRQIQIIGQAAKRLTDDFKDRHPEIPWREVAGMRDVLVHDYGDVDLDAVWSVVEKDIPPLRFAVERALREADAPAKLPHDPPPDAR